MRKLDDRVVLITGGSRGLRFEVARLLASHGATVLLSARTVEQARAASEQLTTAGDVRPLPVALDISVPEAVDAGA